MRFAFHLFYNPFAFTYDFVSAVVSRGRWRAWTRAAIPRLRGTRILEVPCGTGNLLLDLVEAGYTPIGVDLSPWMLRIAQGKFARRDAHGGGRPRGSPLLARARVQALPFASRTFDSVVMTFPPGFVFDPQSFAEIARVLADDGRLIWVDGARLLPSDAWTRLLNRAFDLIDGSAGYAGLMASALESAGYHVTIEQVRDDWSGVLVATATKL